MGLPTLVIDAEMRRFGAIEKFLGKVVEKPELPEELGPAPECKPGERSNNKRDHFNKGKRPGGGGKGGSGGNRGQGGPQHNRGGNRQGQGNAPRPQA